MTIDDFWASNNLYMNLFIYLFIFILKDREKNISVNNTICDRSMFFSNFFWEPHQEANWAHCRATILWWIIHGADCILDSRFFKKVLKMVKVFYICRWLKKLLLKWGLITAKKQYRLFLIKGFLPLSLLWNQKFACN